MFAEEKNNREVKRGKYLAKENIFFAEEEEGKCYHSGTNDRTRKDRTTQPMDVGTLSVQNYFFAEEKKNGEGKGVKYLEKGNMFFLWRRKTEKEKENGIFRGEIYFFAEEKVKEENIWRRKIYFFRRRTEMNKEEGGIIWRRKMLPWRDNEQTNKER